MFEILFTVMILGTFSTKGSSISVTHMGSYPDAVSCEGVASKLRDMQELGSGNTKIQTAQCVQVTIPPKAR